MVKSTKTAAAKAPSAPKAAPKSAGWGAKDKATEAKVENETPKTGTKSVVESIKAAEEAGAMGYEKAENGDSAAKAPEKPADASQPDPGAITQAESVPSTPASPDEAVSSETPKGFPAGAIEQAPNPMEEQKAAEAADKAKDDPQPTGGNLGADGKRLVSFVERIERMNEEIAGAMEDRKEIYAEAKRAGFDTATIRKAISRRAMDPDKRAEQDALLDLYEHTLGEF